MKRSAVGGDHVLFWDTSALLALQCGKDDLHEAAESVFSGRRCAAVRSRAEFYCAATGRLRISTDIALALLASLDEFVEGLPLSEADEARVIAEAPRRELQGRNLYDALIAESAVKAGRNVIVTANPTRFRHVIPWGEIIDLRVCDGFVTSGMNYAAACVGNWAELLI